VPVARRERATSEPTMFGWRRRESLDLLACVVRLSMREPVPTH